MPGVAPAGAEGSVEAGVPHVIDSRLRGNDNAGGNDRTGRGNGKKRV